LTLKDGGGCLTTFVSAQFNAGSPWVASGAEIVSSGHFFVVAQPARKIRAQKRIPVGLSGLNTRPLCGTQKRTQAVLLRMAYLIRLIQLRPL
jgi:hypothetical protein